MVGRLILRYGLSTETSLDVDTATPYGVRYRHARCIMASGWNSSLHKLWKLARQWGDRRRPGASPKDSRAKLCRMGIGSCKEDRLSYIGAWMSMGFSLHCTGIWALPTHTRMIICSRSPSGLTACRGQQNYGDCICVSNEVVVLYMSHRILTGDENRAGCCRVRSVPCVRRWRLHSHWQMDRMSQPGR